MIAHTFSLGHLEPSGLAAHSVPSARHFPPLPFRPRVRPAAHTASHHVPRAALCSSLRCCAQLNGHRGRGEASRRLSPRLQWSPPSQAHELPAHPAPPASASHTWSRAESGQSCSLRTPMPGRPSPVVRFRQRPDRTGNTLFGEKNRASMFFKSQKLSD